MKTKKLLLVLLVMAVGMAFNVNAQITLDTTFADNQGLSIVRLDVSGDKYLQYDVTNEIVKLYNMNHSVFKTITLPAMNPSGATISISYISQNLFNSDNAVELLCFTHTYAPNYNPYGSVEIIDENGTPLFTGDSMEVVEQRAATWYGYDDKGSYIYNTSAGTKMILYSEKVSDPGFKVYSLPGTLTALSDIKNNNSIDKYAFPNPSNSNITIPYDLAGNQNAELTIYDTNGRQVEKMEIDKTFKNVFIDVSKYDNGIYLYTINRDEKVINNGKFIVSK